MKDSLMIFMIPLLIVNYEWLKCKEQFYYSLIQSLNVDDAI